MPLFKPLPSQSIRVLLLFFLLFTLASIYSYLHCWNDPTSYFFAPRIAYEPQYSLVREQEAITLINKFNPTVLGEDNQWKQLRRQKAKVCVGIMTIHRLGKQHLPGCIGSLLSHLSLYEREELYLIVFFSDPAPEEENEFFKAPWVRRLADKVLIRMPENGTEMAKAKKFVVNGMRQDKSSLDYHFLLQECASTGSDYVMMVEDDTIFSRDWYKALKRGIKGLDGDEIWNMDSKTPALPTSVSRNRDTVSEPPTKGTWLYIRLFYSETFLGWNREEYTLYARHIAFLFSLLALSLFFFQRLLFYFSQRYVISSKFRAFPRLQTSTIAIILFICFPISLLLFHASGRLSVSPLKPNPSTGLVLMNEYGCCSQGLVFPKTHVQNILKAVEPENKERGTIYPDQRIERLGLERGLDRYAVVPAVMQHVGRVSAGGIPKKTWNFGFEWRERSGEEACFAMP